MDVIQPLLFFILGFMCAGFIAMMIAPAIWRRAVSLTSRRIEASMPLSRDEIRAEKDAIRAEYAMTVRKLEKNIQSLRTKTAEQTVEISRSDELCKRLSLTDGDKTQAIEGLERRNAEIEAELSKSVERIAELSEKSESSKRKAKDLAAELKSISRLYEDASFASSNRQIELASRDSEIDSLRASLAAAKRDKQDAEKRVRDAALEIRLAKEKLKEESKKVTVLDAKSERMVADLADREDRLDRREKELERLKGNIATPMNDEDAPLPESKKIGDVKRLEARLTTLMRENKRLKTASGKRGRASEASDGDDALREEMHKLAAEVVNLTLLVEGPNSPISKILDKDEKTNATPSLADRVRALQDAAKS
jgi:chromosome segregation ATPase